MACRFPLAACGLLCLLSGLPWLPGVLPAFAAASAHAASPGDGATDVHGVILLYHRISDEGPGSTRVAPARFEAHLDALVDGGYRVLPLADLLAAEGLWGLAQQSGAVGPGVKESRVPRFPLYHGADGDDRLRTALAARPLAAGDEAEPQVFLPPGEPSPGRWRFRPVPGAWREETLACYSAKGTSLALVRDGAWVEVTLPAFRPGRNKVNCTAQAIGGGHAWLSRLWVRADAAGTWLRE